MTMIKDKRDNRIYRVENLHVAYHQIPDEKGDIHATKCVEYTVMGENHNWDFWMFYEDFKKANPNIHIKNNKEEKGEIKQ